MIRNWIRRRWNLILHKKKCVKIHFPKDSHVNEPGNIMRDGSRNSFLSLGKGWFKVLEEQ